MQATCEVGGARGAVAWGDESIVGTGGAGRTYLLGAVTLAEGDAAEAGLARLRELKPRRAHKLHWSDADDRHRCAALAAIAGMPVSVTIVTCDFDAGRRGASERARRTCLETLLWRLEGEGVGLLVLEARDAANNRRDVRMIDALRTRRQIGTIEIEHCSSRSGEARLWLSDQLLGTYGDQIAGRTGTWVRDWEGIEGRLTVLQAWV